MSEMQETLNDFLRSVPDEIIQSWASGNFEVDKVVEWVGKSVAEWREDEQKKRDDAYAACEIHFGIPVNADAEFLLMHEKALRIALAKVKEMVMSGHYGKNIAFASVQDTEIYYKHLLMAQFFFPIFEDEEFNKSVLETYGDWENLGLYIHTDYSSIKPMKEFERKSELSKKNRWFCSTALEHSHTHWLSYKEGKKSIIPYGELFND